jgi:dihydrodipicolinate synthase/N-acetylneuraminate lyase
VRHVVQEGYGADMVFAAGTTGEWDKLPLSTIQKTIQVCTEEVGKINTSLRHEHARKIECWAGVTAHNPRDTLENLDFAIAHGADAAVLAPLSIRGIDDPVRFVARDVSDLLDARARRIPIYLYDNADIAVDPRVPHIHTRQVKAMSRLDFVRGIKVSASRKVLGHYTKAAAGFRERGEFGIYVGNARLIFDLFRPRSGALGSIAERWNRFWLQGSLPIGVVAGPANVLAREWARAWQVCRAGDWERMQEVREVLEAFRTKTRTPAGRRPTVACMKRALYTSGVIGSDAVAPGTPSLDAEEAARFDESFASLREFSRSKMGQVWCSRYTAS